MTDQITVPRETWEALREVLKLCYEHCRVYHPEVDTNNVGQSVCQALTAANAVSDQDLPVGKCGVLSKSEPQAQGEARLPVYFAQYEYAPDFSVVVSVYRRRADDVPELIHSEALPKQIDDHPQATEPAGYQRVPVEPTPEMLYAIQNDCDILPPRGKRIWAAMLAAAPEAKQ